MCIRDRYQIGPQQLHLIQADQAQSEIVNRDKWGRNRHIAFGISDLEEIRQILANQHIPVQMSASGRAALFTHDPDGNIIELTEVS